MDEAINPGRGELICVHRVLLTSLGWGWLCVPHGFTVHYYSSPGCTWGAGWGRMERAWHTWVPQGTVLPDTAQAAPSELVLLQNTSYGGNSIWISVPKAGSTRREGLVAESELHHQHKTQECVPSEPPGRAQLQHRDHSCACWRSEPIRAGSPSLALCCRKPSSITQQLHNYNMDNRFRSCCLSRFPPDLLIT